MCVFLLFLCFFACIFLRLIVSISLSLFLAHFLSLFVCHRQRKLCLFPYLLFCLFKAPSSSLSPSLFLSFSLSQSFSSANSSSLEKRSSQLKSTSPLFSQKKNHIFLSLTHIFFLQMKQKKRPRIEHIHYSSILSCIFIKCSSFFWSISLRKKCIPIVFLVCRVYISSLSVFICFVFFFKLLLFVSFHQHDCDYLFFPTLQRLEHFD